MTPTEQSTSDGIGLTLAPEALDLPPGGLALVSLTVTNRSRVVEQYELRAEGPNAEWVIVRTPGLRLMPAMGPMPGPDSSGVFELEVRVPDAPAPRAGRHDIRLTVTARGGDQGVASVGLSLDVATIAALTMALAPQRVTARRSGRFDVVLTNASNADQPVDLLVADPDAALAAGLEADGVTVPMQAERRVRLTLRPRRWRLFPPPQHFQFTVTCRPADTELAEPLNVAYGELMTLGARPPRALVDLSRRVWVLALPALLAAVAAVWLLSEPGRQTLAAGRARERASPGAAATPVGSTIVVPSPARLGADGLGAPPRPTQAGQSATQRPAAAPTGRPGATTTPAAGAAGAAGAQPSRATPDRSPLVPINRPLEAPLPRRVRSGNLEVTVAGATIGNRVPGERFGNTAASADGRVRAYLEVSVANLGRPGYLFWPLESTITDVARLALSDGQLRHPEHVVGQSLVNPRSTEEVGLVFAVPADATWRGAKLVLERGAGHEPAVLPLDGPVPAPQYPATLPAGAEVNARGTEGALMLRYRLLSATLDLDLDYARADLGKRFLSLSFRVTNDDPSRTATDDSSALRLLVDGVPLAPLAAKGQVTIQPRSAQEQWVVFALPVTAPRAELHLGRGREVDGRLAIDLTAAKPPPSPPGQPGPSAERRTWWRFW